MANALQSVYPFKINRLSISNGDVTYVDKSTSKPLHITKLNFASDNIRNIHEPNDLYPSRFWAEMVVFDQGKLSLDGRANYLMKPFPGVMANYVLTGCRWVPSLPPPAYQSDDQTRVPCRARGRSRIHPK